MTTQRGLRCMLLCLMALTGMLAGCSTPPAPDTPAPQPTAVATATDLPLSTVLATLLADSTQPHDAGLSGVPDSYDWSRGPRPGRLHNPGQMRAMIAWGQLYAQAGGSPARNVRVQIANIEAWLLSKKNGRWSRVQHDMTVEGAAYREDFANDVNVPADLRRNMDGSVAVKLASGYNYHFWPRSGRVSIDPDDIAGVVTLVRARLVVDDPQRPDDRAQARLLLGMGGDYWLSLDAQWDASFQNNGDIAIGRMKWVTNDWQVFGMTTLDENALRSNPPPIAP